MHPGFIEFSCGQCHCCLVDFTMAPPKAGLPFLLLYSLHPILMSPTSHGSVLLPTELRTYSLKLTKTLKIYLNVFVGNSLYHFKVLFFIPHAMIPL